MTHRIIGTAGHIDHGKTALIRALTGRDTDSLAEEKRRGISIDLGFTWFDLPDGSRAGVVDVPGHERFLPNMLSGAGGMDLVLLVIALDEGIMPQTREHMDILELLEMPEGIVVLTKEDCVDAEWADMAEEEIREELADTLFALWPVLRVSAVTGSGIGRLKEKILEKLECPGLFEEKSVFRLPVDRVIPLKGLGTAAAGTVLEGKVRTDEEIFLYPEEKKVRIRGIQIHGEAQKEAGAGQRASLLLGGIGRNELRRGQVLAASGILYPSDRLDVRLRMVYGAKRVLKNRSRLHLHIGTEQLVCRVVLFGTEQISAGESCFAQLLLESPAAVRQGDCFVVRFFSPMETIGGGKILDACPQPHKRSDEAVREQLALREERRYGDLVKHRLMRETKPVSETEILKYIGIGAAGGKDVLKDLEKITEIRAVYVSASQCFWQSTQWWEKKKDEICSALAGYHETWPFREGMERTVLREATASGWEQGSFEAWLDQLEEENVLKQKGTQVCVSGFLKRENALTESLFGRLAEKFEKAQYDFCSIAGLCPPNMEKDLYKELIDFLAEKGKIVKVSEEFYTTPELAEGMKNAVKRYMDENGSIDIAALRDLLHTTRRSAKPAMEYLIVYGVISQ